MSVFIDTSAIYAIVDSDDAHHEKAFPVWESMINENEWMYTSNYVLVETISLLQNRIGMEAVEALSSDILPFIRVLTVDEVTHRTAFRELLENRRKKLSFVDFTSFQVDRHGLLAAAQFDAFILVRAGRKHIKALFFNFP